MRLEESRQEAWLCNHCSMCTQTVNDDSGFYRVCPVYEQLRFEDSSARGHNTIAFYLLNGTLKYSEDVARCIYDCTTCYACEEICKPLGNMMAQIGGGTSLKIMLPSVMNAFGAALDPVHSVQILEAMRADCVDLGLQPLPLKETAVNAGKEHNPYGEPHSSRFDWSRVLETPRTAEVALFAGCTASYRKQEIALATARILINSGVHFALLPEEWCCGSPLLRAGNVDVARKMIEHNVSMLRQKNIRQIITPCAECYMAINRDWPNVSGNLPFGVLHMSQLLARLMGAGRVKIRKRLNAKVVYHDPCHLGRAMGIYDEPRTVLNSIPGVKLAETYPTRHAAWCCGAGGGLKESNPELAVDIGLAKVPSIKGTGASILASSCPFCEAHFADVMEKAGERIQVRDLTELVAEAMGV
ncbi:MAG: (Fe-S)-binding protein [Dehalococcoidia bacterium]|nr:(Fe-S)-binding protein [Dehalococcoidia bacterium]